MAGPKRAGAARLVLSMATLLFSTTGHGQQAVVPVPREPPEPPSTKYAVVVPGLLGNTPLAVQFRTYNLRLEFRDLIMGRGEARDVPLPTRTIMELRGGSVVTTLNDERKTRVQGDIWTVAKADRLSLENAHDVAVIRAIYVFEDGR